MYLTRIREREIEKEKEHNKVIQVEENDNIENNDYIVTGFLPSILLNRQEVC